MQVAVIGGIAFSACLTLGASLGSAQPLSQSLGQFEYENSCAACHGVSGEGDGPMVGHLTASPADLTVLQQENGGVFPVERLYSMISGDVSVGAHGSSEMPAWGMTFKSRAELDPNFSPEASESYARVRILALIEHLSTLQK